MLNLEKKVVNFIITTVIEHKKMAFPLVLALHHSNLETSLPYTLHAAAVVNTILFLEPLSRVS